MAGSYAEWQGEGLFYPPGLKSGDLLSFYATRFPTVELDGTWYRMPSARAVEGWNARTPPGFRFAPKVHRNVTHMARLKLEAIDSLKFMLKRLRPLAVDGKLGPLLVQLPPNLKQDLPRLEAFLLAAPKTVGDAIDDPSCTVPVRYAVEFRNTTWHTAETEALLCAHNAAWVGADTDEAEAQRRPTADFAYFRLRKTEYTPEALDAWRSDLREWVAGGRDAFVYCKRRVRLLQARGCRAALGLGERPDALGPLRSCKYFSVLLTDRAGVVPARRSARGRPSVSLAQAERGLVATTNRRAR